MATEETDTSKTADDPTGKSTEQTSADTAEPAFPANTPVAEMNPVQQAAYWKAQSRKHEQRAKSVPAPDELKKLRDDAAELEKVRQASMGEQERAVATAKAEAAASTAREYALRLVAAEFRAATAGRMSRDDLAATLEPLDLSKFVSENGDVDVERVTTYADRLAPKNGQRFPDLGQGSRSDTAKPSVATGRAAYEARKGQRNKI